MKQTIYAIKGFLHDESGATAVEYGLLLALMTVALVGALGALSQSNSDNFNEVSDNFPK